MQCYLQPLGHHCTRFLPVQCCPKNITTTLNRIFPVQYCLESQGQHCPRYLLVQCCRKSFKTTLNRIFFSAMSSGSSWTTLHRITLLSKITYTAYQAGTTIYKNIVYSCCPNTSETTLHKKITGAMLAQTHSHLFAGK